MSDETILPDLQGCLLCEDVRQEASGQQTLVGVIGAIPAQALPLSFFKLCIWTRWCGGIGRFHQEARILTPEDESLAHADVNFELPALETHATNVHVFGGLQFRNPGIYSIEILLDGELKIRVALPVVHMGNPQ